MTIVFYRFKLKDEYWNWILAPQSLSGCSPWRFETGGHLHPLLQVGIIHCYIGTTIVGNNNQENMVTSGERDIYHALAGFDWSHTNQDFSAWAGEGGSLVDRKSRKMRKEVKSTSEHQPSLLKWIILKFIKKDPPSPQTPPDLKTQCSAKDHHIFAMSIYKMTGQKTVPAYIDHVAQTRLLRRGLEG